MIAAMPSAADTHPTLAIALVTETYPPEINGVAMTMSRLVGGLAARGHRIQVVRPRQVGELGEPAQADPQVRELVRPGLPIPGYSALRLGIPSTGVLLARWRAQRPDVVHVVTEGPLGCSALNAAEKLGIPVTSSYHTNFDDYTKHYRIGMLGGVVEGWLRRFHNRTSVTMVPSTDLVGRLERSGYRNCALWSRGVDLELFNPAHRDQGLRSSWGASPDDLVCLHVGRVAPEKDIAMALEAFRAIRAVLPRARMLVAGEGPSRPALQRAFPEVQFTGALPVADLARTYASADLFLFPSRSETFGNVLCEAMASGLPAVGFDYAAARMHGRDGANMLTVPFDQPDRFTPTALRLAGDPALRAALAAEGLATMQANAWSRVVDRFEELLWRSVRISRGSALEALCT
ncbi:MAG: glycosyltransferase family 1 protein [Planctomycetes bacterium]|nr:glycosyltransferase family 1 protein [Planctomycetota bacterium]